MSVTGPDGYSSALNNIQSLGDLQGMGNDAFSASTDVISGGKDGSVYNCTSFNGVSQVSNSSNRLRGNFNTVLMPSLHYKVHTFSSCLYSYNDITGADISHCCESGVESAIRRGHSDWLCSALQ